MPTDPHFPNGSPALLTIKHQSSSFSGPLPPPEMLKEYNEVLPGMANRILAMAENQSVHRLEIEKKGVANEITLSQRGQWCAFAFAILALISGTVLVAMGHAAAGGVITGVPFASIVSAFLYSTYQKRKERADRAKVMTGAKQLTA